MQYLSQAVAKPYFIAAIVIFVVQIVFGLIAGLQYIIGNFLLVVLPFNITRVIHIDLLIIWLLFGFMGSAYYIVPDEAKRELHDIKLAIILFWILVVTTVLMVASYLFFSYATLNNLTGNNWFPTMGREFIGQPIFIKLGIMVVIAGFVYNIGMTIWKSQKTIINLALFIGFASSIIFYLFSLYSSDNVVIEKYFNAWVIHLWFECSWELIMVAILAFIMQKLTGSCNHEKMEKWLYIIMAIIVMSGIIGTGHRYFWIGAPSYWQWIGSIFSVLEPLPFFILTVMVFNMIHYRCNSHTNKAATLWVVGTVVVTFLGAGVLGFIHALAPINYYTHGTQITAAHSHLSFYGAYVMLVLSMISYAMPILQSKIYANSTHSQIWEMWSFWLMTASMVFIALFLMAAGILQVYLQRASETPLPFLVIQEKIYLFYWLRELAGFIFLIGLIIYIVNFFVEEKNSDQ
ncbi:MAG: cbb3-type cytochrome c oxidase subunit I [Thiomargarita sp.]|nr:cbb3-type cytochrome c oxidase subunit I [Thiomargarita sp.]